MLALTATSQLDLSRQTVNGNAGRYSSQSIYPRDDSGKSRVSASSFLDEHGVTTPTHQRTDGVGEVSAAPFESPGSLHLSTYGGQPDDRPNKPIEGARSEITRLQIENDRLTSNSHEFETQLNEVRTTLATLRNRLLEDNLTEYLELPHESNNYMGYGSNNFGGYMNSSSFDNSQHANAAIEPQSFLSKISSLSMNARLPNFISPMNSLHTNGSNTNSGGSAGGGGWW
ncbi:tRNA-splicing endonuclease subunit Sen2 [Schistosoma japonicum]|nr:tRNA-splicing endonuclease subunit Sen2 [Schistosoma japonicum]